MNTTKLIKEYDAKVAQCEQMIQHLAAEIRTNQQDSEGARINKSAWQARRQAYVQFIQELRDLDQ